MVGVTIDADLDPLEKTINDAKTKCYVDFGGGHYWTPIHILPFDRAHGSGFGHNGPEPLSGQFGGPDCMRWVAPSEKDAATATLEKRLWNAAEWKHGRYSSEVIAKRKAIRQLLSDAKETIERV